MLRRYSPRYSIPPTFVTAPPGTATIQNLPFA
jgi:hypothetical protein